MNRDRPGAIVLVNVAVDAPSKLTKRAVTVASTVPKFCITKVVIQRTLQVASVCGIAVHGAGSGFATKGRYTVVAPVVSPLYESASARAPTPPWCSLTTETTSEPNDFTTTENWASGGRSASLFG